MKLERRAGWRLPAGAKSVAYPSKWQNPFRPHERSHAANAVAVEQFRIWLPQQRPELIEQARTELAGHDLACWCDLDLPCHRSVWLRVAAGGEP